MEPIRPRNLATTDTGSARTDLSALVELTTMLVQDAELIVEWRDDLSRDIQQAYARGYTFDEWETLVDEAIARYESGEVQQDLWERQAGLVGDPTEGLDGASHTDLIAAQAFPAPPQPHSAPIDHGSTEGRRPAERSHGTGNGYAHGNGNRTR
ncbi:hypothetical protein OHQ88_34345 (plasmid) [Micromonospora zamorensis]|uniref:hypothetical protein n=1 Tax=Micromonospora zamorensis TaxID=709883 RepID=UPI002E251238